MSTTSLPSSGIREYFLLADARATAGRIPNAARDDIARKLALGRQRAEAADALWSNGHTAEGLRLAAEAFDATLEAVPAFADATGIGSLGGDMGEPADDHDEGATEEEDGGEASEAEAGGDSDEAQAAGDGADDSDESDGSEEAAHAAEDEGAADESDDSEEAPAAEAAADDGDGSEEAHAAADDAGESDDSEEAPAADAEEAAAAEAEEATGADDSDEAEASEAGEAEEAASAEEADAAGADDAAGEDGEPEAAEETAAKPEPEIPAAAPWVTPLRTRGLSPGRIREIVTADKLLRGSALPALDEDISAQHGELFQQLVSARRYVDKALAPATMTPTQITWTRVTRIGVASLLVVALAAGAFLLLRTPEGMEATASANYNPDFGVDNVIDEDPASEWLLPDRRAGWAEIAVSPPQDISVVRLLNSHNRNYNDRATRDYTVELYSDGELAQTIEGRFDQVEPRPQWVEHEAQASDVDRIRVNVRSWHRNGGGLAEIDWH